MRGDYATYFSRLESWWESVTDLADQRELNHKQADRKTWSKLICIAEPLKGLEIKNIPFLWKWVWRWSQNKEWLVKSLFNYPTDLNTYTNTKTLRQIFIAASFINPPNEATKMSFSKWMDKQTHKIVHTYNYILFSDKKKWAMKLRKDMNES